MKLTVKHIRCWSSGTFIVSGSIKWIVHKHQRKNKKLQEAIIYDGTDHVKITLWEDQSHKKKQKHSGMLPLTLMCQTIMAQI